MSEELDFEEVRRNKFSLVKTPADWPSHVRSISLEGVALLGVSEKTGRLYWDGEEIVTRVQLGRREIALAVAVAASAVGVFVIELGRSAGWWQGG